ncbi:hypothetical protein BX666DRAFT_1830364, partial [Dichotomocladium elegans]
LPMTRTERSRCIRWRIGWLSGGKHRPCRTCRHPHFSKRHAITCLQMHHRLNISEQHCTDPLPKAKPTFPKRIRQLRTQWPIVCTILVELDAHQHPASDQCKYLDTNPGSMLINWI